MARPAGAVLRPNAVASPVVEEAAVSGGYSNEMNGTIHAYILIDHHILYV